MAAPRIPGMLYGICPSLVLGQCDMYEWTVAVLPRL
jgi:hypothetical protein